MSYDNREKISDEALYRWKDLILPEVMEEEKKYVAKLHTDGNGVNVKLELYLASEDNYPDVPIMTKKEFDNIVSSCYWYGRRYDENYLH